MARTLITTYTNMANGALDNFRQGFVDALVREGNEVLVLRSNDLLANFRESNRLPRAISRDRLLKHIRRFNPDVIISLNHSGMVEGLADAVQCPIGVWLLD